jgi:hypothetical protein
MAKVGKLRKAEQYVLNKLPQTGFFSTLDELIASAPFEENSIEQWRNYLKPGRVLEREGVRFPLKQEEIDYSGLMRKDLEGIQSGLANKWTKSELRQMIQGSRPDFGLRLGVQGFEAGPLPRVHIRDQRFPEERVFSPDYDYDLESREGVESYRQPPEVGRSRYSDWAYKGVPGTYEESSTRSGNFGPYETHFGPDVISHSRSSVHKVPPLLPDGTFASDYENPDVKLARLVEEIQSDRHQKAADRVGTGVYNTTDKTLPRRGYLTTEESREFADLPKELADINQTIRLRVDEVMRDTGMPITPGELKPLQDRKVSLEERYANLRDKVPDAPFKDPADYGLLELRNQLLNAVKSDQDYLALVRGADVSARFGQTKEDAAGTSHVYDKVYRSQLDKLARQYGATVEDVRLPNVARKADVRPETMRNLDVEDTYGLLESVVDIADEFEPEGVEGSDRSKPFDRLDDVIHEMVNITNNPSKEMKDQAHRASVAVRSLRSKWKNTGIDISDRDREDPAFEAAAREMRKLYEIYEPIARADLPEELADNSFPAMKLTPEIRELVKKVGVPIWALGSMSLLGEDEETGMAEGGDVGKHAGLNRLKKMAEFLGSHLDDREMDPQQKRRLGLLASGIASQLYGLDTKGEPSLLGFDPNRANPGATPLSRLAGMLRPGLVDDLVSLPAAFSDNAPQASKDAAARMEALENRIYREMDLPPPEGLAENFAQSLGVMAGQLPVPSSAGKTAAKGSVKGIKRMRDLLTKIAGSPVEFLAPTVDPSILNYGLGAGFGAGLGALGGPNESGFVPKITDDSKWDASLEELLARTNSGDPNAI